MNPFTLPSHSLASATRRASPTIHVTLSSQFAASADSRKTVVSAPHLRHGTPYGPPVPSRLISASMCCALPEISASDLPHVIRIQPKAHSVNRPPSVPHPNSANHRRKIFETLSTSRRAPPDPSSFPSETRRPCRAKPKRCPTLRQLRADSDELSAGSPSLLRPLPNLSRSLKNGPKHLSRCASTNAATMRLSSAPCTRSPPSATPAAILFRRPRSKPSPYQPLALP